MSRMARASQQKGAERLTGRPCFLCAARQFAHAESELPVVAGLNCD